MRPRPAMVGLTSILRPAGREIEPIGPVRCRQATNHNALTLKPAGDPWPRQPCPAGLFIPCIGVRRLPGG